MKTLCSWCAAIITEGDHGLVSHGICNACKTTFSFEESDSLQTFIDRLPVPVVVLDGSLGPVCTNKTGRETFHLIDGEVESFTLGEIVECENSRLPGGCGKTVHCSGCVLRRTITETYDTGRQASMVPAQLKAHNQYISCYVSTVKVGDCVVVKLDS